MPPCKVSSVADYDEAKKDLIPGGIHQKKTMEAKQESVPPKQQDLVLRSLYIATALLCLGMVFWILVFPASCWIGHSKYYREVLIPYLEQQNLVFLVVPSITVTKYQGHNLVQFTHILPSALWAAILPFQLHPTFRKNNPRLHRVLGYLFLACTLLVAAGVFVILQRKLTYEHYFDLDMETRHELQTPAMTGMSLWFAFTALKAVYLARSRSFRRHQTWMVRHVASGIWIAVQRFVMIPPAILYYHLMEQQPSPFAQREIFGNSAVLAWFLCIGLGEVAVQRVHGKEKLS